MSFDYSYPDILNLFVEGRITEVDANRQSVTARAILDRLKFQPGVILADEVGMGKTFVALAVAISVFLKDNRPSVIMIPPNLVSKWPNDFRLFVESCITDPQLRPRLQCEVAERPEKFFQLLDDSAEKRKAVIFLTHGALTRNLGDGWIKLAIIQRALYRRKLDSDAVYAALGKYAGELTELKYVETKTRNPGIWSELLNKTPDKWRKILIKNCFGGEELDDPVPTAFLLELDRLSTKELDQIYHSLRDQLPRRASDSLKDRLKTLRQILSEEQRSIWKKCLAKIKLDLPLLIFDEAHHLKNEKTKLVKTLFSEAEAGGQTTSGMLAGQFDRILFLTATPFQLGHHELLSVLERFTSVNWTSKFAPAISREEYKTELENLRMRLDTSQTAAKIFDKSWGKLTADHLVVDGSSFEDVYAWWCSIKHNPAGRPTDIQKLISDFESAQQKLALVEPLLKKYIIRHLKPRMMSGDFNHVPRRNKLAGDGIVTELISDELATIGLPVSQDSLLPFLLAARLSSIQSTQRPVFAEGLASSYQAFRHTREDRLKQELLKITGTSHPTDTDDEAFESTFTNNKSTDWYLSQLDKALELSSKTESEHPKLIHTVNKAIDLWSRGEKVLIFCHYVATGKALQQYISNAMRVHIKQVGAAKFEISESEIFDHLEKLGHKITTADSELTRFCIALIDRLIDTFPDLNPDRPEIIAVILRYMRTPSFLVRFAGAGDNINQDWLEASFEAKDHSGVTLKGILVDFLKFLNNRKENRTEYLKALMSIQPGGIRTRDVIDAYENDDTPEEHDNIVMPNVRLCYGQTEQSTRLKLMKTFNTPFFPDILITSSVMAEGVDLHLNCRHIIHHDLSWNPSTLEQRTGRIDRIGAKAERCGSPIKVYLPYLSETQDEKMYKVVTERERWFNIVMGEKYKIDAMSVDKYVERVMLPEQLSRELSFKLEVKQ